MYACAQCTVHACSREGGKNPSPHCPMNQTGVLEQAGELYQKPEFREFYIRASEMEALGYGVWTRVKETVTLCHAMGYSRVGLAFCRGLRREAKILDDILRRNGLDVVSVICKVGGVPKESVGIDPARKVHPEAFEPMCNPAAQALLCNQQKTQFNIVLGLCVGHDSMFYKHAEALTTTIAVKDRVLAHNPLGALYCAEGYFAGKLNAAEMPE